LIAIFDCFFAIDLLQRKCYHVIKDINLSWLVSRGWNRGLCLNIFVALFLFSRKVL
jgi:hypothetical protein